MSGNGYANWSGRTPGCGRGRELEKTSCGLLGEGVEGVTLYRFVDAQRAEGFPVKLICSVTGVSPSAYYAYRKRPEVSPTHLAEPPWSTRSRSCLLCRLTFDDPRHAGRVRTPGSGRPTMISGGYGSSATSSDSAGRTHPHTSASSWSKQNPNRSAHPGTRSWLPTSSAGRFGRWGEDPFVGGLYRQVGGCSGR